jgi:Fur family transcriptional regulator, zinc uptake regulator
MDKMDTAAPDFSSDDTGAKRLEATLEHARSAFLERNLRFTDLREQVFTEIASTHGSIGAYEILERLSEKGTRLAPISVYRSIDALIDAGVIHRLESKNAYFACRRHEHGKKGRPIFLSCEQCGGVTEVVAPEIFEGIKQRASEAGFEPRVKFVEVSGTCENCRKK